MARLGPGYRPVILHADQQRPTAGVGQRHDLFVDRAIADLLPVGLELHLQRLAGGNLLLHLWQANHATSV
jgi:hypothetical protein